MDEYLKELTPHVDFNQNRSIQEIVYDGLKTWIINSNLPLGYRINEVHVSKTLNISRTPVREAMKQLTHEGLLESKHNLGTIVRKITKEDVIEVYKLRVVLETLSFTSAMQNMNIDQLNQLDELLDRTLDAHADGDDDLVVELSGQFNRFINDLAKMPRLAALLKNLKDYIYRFRVIAMTSKERGRIAILEHKMIVKAMRNNDEKQIQYVVEEHLMNSLDCIIGYVDEVN